MAAANLRKHGVSFEGAAEAIRTDMSVVKDFDDSFDHGEDRTKAYATLQGTILVIIYTMRGEIFRLISARTAGKQECDYYHSQNLR